MSEQLFGWVPPEGRTPEQQTAHAAIVAQMPVFSLPGYRDEKGRFALWQFCKQVNGGQHIPYAWQLTGSCVGAGGSNMLRTLARVEIANGDPEEWQELWWVYTYGQSRRRGGMNGQGEGSLGSAWAKAIVEDGIFSLKEGDEKQNLPDFKVVDGWLQLSRSIEMTWSDGGAKNVEPWKSLALKHPVKTAAPIRTAEEAKAAIQNGYPLTIASNFGTRTIRPQGSPAVNIAEWDATWPHQMYLDEAWDHPTLGLIFRDGNNWGPDAHPAPTQGEPPGGFYYTAKTLDRILSSWGTECYAFSAFDGFQLRDLNWVI